MKRENEVFEKQNLLQLQKHWGKRKGGREREKREGAQDKIPFFWGKEKGKGGVCPRF